MGSVTGTSPAAAVDAVPMCKMTCFLLMASLALHLASVLSVMTVLTVLRWLGAAHSRRSSRTFYEEP